MSRNTVVSTLAIVHDSSSDPHYNYILGNEDYTGAITPRPVTVHSLYLDNPEQPRNVKTYDGTDKATIRNIILDNVLGDAVTLKEQVLTGTYATAETGETLNSDGTPQTDRLKKLTENVITADTHAELQGDTYGDYYIAEERYSGAISRALLEVHTKSERKMYGAADIETPWFIRDFDAKSTGSVDGWLSITGLEGKDTLHLEDSFTFGVTNKNGDLFALDSTTPVGVYPVTVGSLTETDYPVLRNYIVAKYDGVAEIYPREIVVTPTDLDWYVEDDGTPTPFAKFEMLNDDEESYTDLDTDADTDYTAMPLIGSDTVASVLGLYRDGSLAAYTEYDKRSVFGKESNISYSTDWYSHAPAIYLDVENDPTLEPCAWCENRHGFTLCAAHQPKCGRGRRTCGSCRTKSAGRDCAELYAAVCGRSAAGTPEAAVPAQSNRAYVCVYVRVRRGRQCGDAHQLRHYEPVQRCDQGYGGNSRQQERPDGRLEHCG